MKDYLSAENARNHRNHKIYERLLKAATGAGEVLIVHHLTFMIPGQEANEIPSADTLIFDLELMTNVFGSKAQSVMQQLAVCNVDTRDALLEQYMDSLVSEMVEV